MADLLDSVWGLHPEAIKAELSSWNALQDWPRTNCQIREVPHLLPTDETPIVLIASIPERLLREGMIGTNDFRLRCLVAVARSRAATSKVDPNLGTNLLWRQTLLNRFHNTRVLAPYMAAATDGHYMSSTVEIGVPADLQAFTKNLAAQYFTIQSRVRMYPTPAPIAP